MHLGRFKSIEHIFLACAVLHYNMLIDYDGGSDWEECEKLKDIKDVAMEQNSGMSVSGLAVQRTL
jgi:hypothetical protein